MVMASRSAVAFWVINAIVQMDAASAVPAAITVRPDLTLLLTGGRWAGSRSA